MKFLVVAALIFAVIGAIVAASVGPTPPSHCDFKCTRLDLPTCATNGRCFLRFTGKCALDKYNCLNPQKAFRQVDEFKCGQDPAPRCQQGDY